MTSDGLYTSVYRYQHRVNPTKVLWVGTNHIGDNEYYRKIDAALGDMEIVIHEEPFARSANEIEQVMSNWKKELFRDDNLDAAFIGALIYSLPPKNRDALGLVEEWVQFDHSRLHWVSGDVTWYQGTPDIQWPPEAWEYFNKGLHYIDLATKREAICDARSFAEKIDQGVVTRKDYIELATKHEASYPHVSALIEDMGQKMRDQIVLKVFHGLMRTKKPSNIGFKFGAAHHKYQHELLEHSGYELIGVDHLLAVTLL